MSVFVDISSSVHTVISNLADASAVVYRRDTDVVHPDEIPSGSYVVIITMGEEREERSVSGEGSSTDQGDRLMSYEIGISIYSTNLAANQSDLSTRPAFITACQQALNKKSLYNVPAVYDTTLVRRDAWERRPFAKGVEKSVFGVIFHTSETRLGNA